MDLAAEVEDLEGLPESVVESGEHQWAKSDHQASSVAVDAIHEADLQYQVLDISYINKMTQITNLLVVLEVASVAGPYEAGEEVVAAVALASGTEVVVCLGTPYSIHQAVAGCD